MTRARVCRTIDALQLTHWGKPADHLPVIRRRLVRRRRYQTNREAREAAKAQARAAYHRNASRLKEQMRLRYAALAILRAALDVIQPPARVRKVRADTPRAVLIVRCGAMVAVPSKFQVVRA